MGVCNIDIELMVASVCLLKLSEVQDATNLRDYSLLELYENWILLK